MRGMCAIVVGVIVVVVAAATSEAVVSLHTGTVTICIMCTWIVYTLTATNVVIFVQKIPATF